MRVLNLGKIDYLEAWKIQKEYVEKVLAGYEDTLIICSHPSVVTLGKKSTKNDLLGWKGTVHEIERGGKATYHGPGQIVIYPILNLKFLGQNIAGFLSALEASMIKTLAHYNIQASGNPERGNPEYTGVWVGDKKLASIGVAIRKWVTYHGLALNLYHDLDAFKNISPCGLTQKDMISVEELIKNKISRLEFENHLADQLSRAIEKLSIAIPPTPSV